MLGFQPEQFPDDSNDASGTHAFYVTFDCELTGWEVLICSSVVDLCAYLLFRRSTNLVSHNEKLTGVLLKELREVRSRTACVWVGLVACTWMHCCGYLLKCLFTWSLGITAVHRACVLGLGKGWAGYRVWASAVEGCNGAFALHTTKCFNPTANLELAAKDRKPQIAMFCLEGETKGIISCLWSSEIVKCITSYVIMSPENFTGQWGISMNCLYLSNLYRLWVKSVTFWVESVVKCWVWENLMEQSTSSSFVEGILVLLMRFERKKLRNFWAALIPKLSLPLHIPLQGFTCCISAMQIHGWLFERGWLVLIQFQKQQGHLLGLKYLGHVTKISYLLQGQVAASEFSIYHLLLGGCWIDFYFF